MQIPPIIDAITVAATAVISKAITKVFEFIRDAGSVSVVKPNPIPKITFTTIYMSKIETNSRSYSKSKLELKFNLSEILPANCKFIRGSTPT